MFTFGGWIVNDILYNVTCVDNNKIGTRHSRLHIFHQRLQVNVVDSSRYVQSFWAGTAVRLVQINHWTGPNWIYRCKNKFPSSQFVQILYQWKKIHGSSITKFTDKVTCPRWNSLNSIQVTKFVTRK